MYIGLWREIASRDITRCPSYYAADWETLRTHVGSYPVKAVTANGSDWHPSMELQPYWLVVSIDTDRIDGRLYSGFGGVNYNSTPLPQEPVAYHIQTYNFAIKELVASGTVVLNEGITIDMIDHSIDHAK